MQLWRCCAVLNSISDLVLKVDRVAVVVLVVTLMTLQRWSLSFAQLNPVDAAALYDLCDRPGTDLWANCSDSANACINTANWTGVTCNASNTAIVSMYDRFCSPVDFLASMPSFPVDCLLENDVVKPRRDHFLRQLGISFTCSACTTLHLLCAVSDVTC